METTWSGLTGTTTVAHIHAPTPVPFDLTASPATQVPSFVGFPTGVTNGAYDMTFNTLEAAAWNASFITANGGTPAGAEAAFGVALAQGRAYLNIHTSTFGGGEIRGFFIPTPGAGAVAGVCIALAGARRRRRRD